MSLFFTGCIGGKVSFIKDKKTGCKVYNPHPVDDESVNWVGGCKDGFANGYGTLEWYVKDKKGSVYIGNLQNGVFEGKGVLRYPNGTTTYEGDFRNGRRHGIGTLKKKNHIIYKGLWKNSAPNLEDKTIYWSSGTIQYHTKKNKILYTKAKNKILKLGDWYREDSKTCAFYGEWYWDRTEKKLKDMRKPKSYCWNFLPSRIEKIVQGDSEGLKSKNEEACKSLKEYVGVNYKKRIHGWQIVNFYDKDSSTQGTVVAELGFSSASVTCTKLLKYKQEKLNRSLTIGF